MGADVLFDFALLPSRSHLEDLTKTWHLFRKILQNESQYRR
jgi:hypothetical protein